jgi:3'-5' exoribonuclease
MKSQYANQLDKSSMAVDSPFAITDIEYKDYSGTKHLLKMLLKDATGSVPAIMWDITEKLQLELKPGTVAQVKGRTEDGKYGFQVVVQSLQPLSATSVDPEDFVETSKRPLKSMEQEIRAAVEGIKSAEIKKFLSTWFLGPDFFPVYMTASAAVKVHHAYRGGLAEHCLETLSVGRHLAEMFPKADSDIVTAGCLLHDIGKIRDYSIGLTLEMTDEGRIMGHILNGFGMLKEQALKYGCDSAPWMKHLYHILVSHHADQDDNTPVQPMTIEAMIVHLSDLASGRLTQFGNVLEGQSALKENWTNYDRFLERSLFKGFQEKK